MILSAVQWLLCTFGAHSCHPKHIIRRLLVVASLTMAFFCVHCKCAGGTLVGWGGLTPAVITFPANLTNVTMIAAGSFHNLALKSDGTIATVPAVSNDPQVSDVIAVAAGYTHNLALRSNGTVIAWGDSNNYGQTNVPPGLSNVVAIAAGGYHSLALKSDGTVVSWGELPDGAPGGPTDLTNVVAIATANSGSEGIYHNLALRQDGSIVAWGANWGGQTNVPAGSTGVVAVGSGQMHSLAVLPNGSVLAWGPGYYGQTNIPSSVSNAVMVTGGAYHVLALNADGTVVGWGNNHNGQTNAPPGLTNVIGIACGHYHSLALVGDQSPAINASLSNFAWSNNTFRISVPSQNGKVYRLEYKDALSDTDWKALALVAGNGGVLALTDPALSTSQRFYRVRRW